MKRDVGLIISIFLAFFLLLVLVSQASAAPSITSWSSSGGTTQNKDNAQDIMYLVLQGDSITFSITATGATSYKWFVNKIDQNNNADTFAWTVPNQKGIWEIRVEASDATGTASKEWVISTLSLSEAPAVFDYFTDGKLTSRTETDPWGRPISNWQNWYGSVSNYENSQYYMTSTDGDNSGKAISLPNAVKYGTWKFRVYHTSREWNTIPGYAFNLKADNSANSNSLYYVATPDTHRYILWRDSPNGDFTRIDEDRGYWFTNAVLWHDYTVIVTRDGWIYDFIDGTLGQVWNIEDPEKPFGAITETSPPTYYTHTPMGNTQGFSLSEKPSYRAYFDNLEIYNETYLFPDSRIVYDKFIDYWGPQNGSGVSPAIKSPAIIIRKMNTTLGEINTAINNPSLFTYDPASRTAVSYTNITVGDAYGIGELVLNGETLLFSPSSNGGIIFSLYHGSRLKLNNSKVDSANNYYWKWRITSTADATGYPPSMLEWDPSWWQIITNGASHVFLGSLEIYNSIINNSANFWVSSPYIMKIRDSKILNLHADKHGSFTGNYPRYVSELKGYWNFDKTFAWDSNYYHLSKFDFTNITFSIAPDSSNSDIILIQNDELFNKLNLYNLDLSNANLRVMKPIKVNTALTVPLKYYNGRTALVNSKWKTVTITTDRAEFVPKYYLDVKVVDLDNNPVQGASVRVTNEVNANYPAENISSVQWFFDDLWCTNSPSYCWTTGTGNFHYPHKIVTYNYNDGRIRYSENAYMPGWDIVAITDTTGHTPLPAFPSNSLVIPDYSQTQTGTAQFTYTITATYGGKTATLAGLNPDETWYRPNPQIPTVTVKCNIDDGTWQLVGPDLGSFSGTIKDADNNPIAGVTVSCLGSTIQTDSNGDYLLSNILVGSRDVSAFKSGYIAQTTTANVVKDRTTTGVNFTLNPAPPNNAPTLSWSGETDYTSDGLNPEAGTTVTTFTFRAKYSDADNDAPAAGYPKAHLKKSGVEIAGSPFTMTADDSNAYNLGRKYTYFTKLSAGTDYSYYFEALDLNSGVATGAPTTAVAAPAVTVSADNQPPSVAISSPLDGQIFNSAAISIVGTANDNVGVDKVEVKVGDATWQAASGITSWNKEVTLVAGTNLISVRVTDTSGNIKETSITVTYRAEEQELLEQKIKVYPNPYVKGKSSSERISFSNLPKEATLKIYNANGKLVKELSNGADGNAEWNISDVGSGVYLYVVSSSEGTKKGKVSVIK